MNAANGGQRVSAAIGQQRGGLALALVGSAATRLPSKPPPGRPGLLLSADPRRTHLTSHAIVPARSLVTERDGAMGEVPRRDGVEQLLAPPTEISMTWHPGRYLWILK